MSLSMKLETYKHCELHQPTSGGKAGKGRNKTSTIQVRNGGCVVKQFRYSLDIAFDKKRAVEKARAWVDERAATMQERRDQARAFKSERGIGATHWDEAGAQQAARDLDAEKHGR